LNKIVLLLVFPFFILAAIEMGSPYNYKFNYKLQLDKTTVEEAIMQYGKPMQRYNVKSDVASYVFLRYYSTELSLFSGKARITYLEFRDNLLYAFITASNFNRDSTKFSYDKAKDIKIGDTIDEVIYRIGEPSGKGKCPMNTGKFSGFCKKGEYTWMWLYANNGGMMNSNNIRAKALLVGVDKEGKVIEVEHDRIAIINEK
jgi:hypothetical protein